MRRRGLHDAGGTVVNSDGAGWIRNTGDGISGDGNITFVLDLWRTLKYASDAVKAILPEGAERDRRFAEIKAGWADRVVRELQPAKLPAQGRGGLLPPLPEQHSADAV